MKAVVDTNVLIASIGTRAPYRWLFDALLEGDLTLAVSNSILAEYEDVLIRKTTGEIAFNVLRALMVLPNLEHVVPHFKWGLIHVDPADNKFVDCALAANADALVTHDAHFDALKTLNFPRVNVISAAQLREALQA